MENNGINLTEQDNCIIVLQIGDRAVSTYKLGQESRYGDLYVLDAPPVADGSEQPVLYVQLNGRKTEVAVLPPGRSGQTVRFDISLSMRSDISILHQNFPNPFNPETWIPYELAEGSDVEIRIYSSTGQVVRKLNLGHKPAGFYTDKEKAAYWDGRNDKGESVADGMYFCTLRAGDYMATKKMILRK